MRHLLFALLITLMPTLATAQTELRVFAAGAVTPTATEMADMFTKRSGTKVVITSDTAGGWQKRVLSGEAGDVIFVTAPVMEVLQKEKRVVDGTRTDLGRALIGVAVRNGAALPDISTVEAFKAALLKAKSVSYVNPAAGGTSGVYMEKLFQTLGIFEQLKGKIVYRTQGALVADAVATGAAEIGITFTSELQPNPGVRVAGTLPASINLPTIYTAAVLTGSSNVEQARAFLKLLTSDGYETLRKAGLEPLAAVVRR
jgi:molybdate transport system substrate-binding protein